MENAGKEKQPAFIMSERILGFAAYTYRLPNAQFSEVKPIKLREFLFIFDSLQSFVLNFYKFLQIIRIIHFYRAIPVTSTK